MINYELRITNYYVSLLLPLYAEDLFEPWLFKTILSFAPIQEYFEILQLMIGVVEELNLNRRIWSKE